MDVSVCNNAKGNYINHMTIMRTVVKHVTYSLSMLLLMYNVSYYIYMNNHNKLHY